jgi:hypothetical protein
MANWVMSDLNLKEPEGFTQSAAKITVNRPVDDERAKHVSGYGLLQAAFAEGRGRQVRQNLRRPMQPVAFREKHKPGDSADLFPRLVRDNPGARERRFSFGLV